MENVSGTLRFIRVIQINRNRKERRMKTKWYTTYQLVLNFDLKARERRIKTLKKETIKESLSPFVTWAIYMTCEKMKNKITETYFCLFTEHQTCT